MSSVSHCVLLIALIHTGIFADLLWEYITFVLSHSSRMTKINGQAALLRASVEELRETPKKVTEKNICALELRGNFLLRAWEGVVVVLK